MNEPHQAMNAMNAMNEPCAVQQLPEDVYAALTDPWQTHPDVLLAAVNAARVMPRAQSRQERYNRWVEEGLNYPAPLVARQLPLRPASARIDKPADGCAKAIQARDGDEAAEVCPVDDLAFEMHVQSELEAESRRQARIPEDTLRQQPSGMLRRTAAGPAAAVDLEIWGRDSSAELSWTLAALIDQALSYVGTPYMRTASKSITAQNTWCKQVPGRLKAAAPVPGAHDRPQLELDCSAFIRQCVVDLQRQFGFVLGGWNQAYQFDTLPLKVDSVDQLEPGDLIFISGIYFDEKRKPKPHNMTHVEMYFPCGPQLCETIGSRHKNGCVQVHKDFRFESKTYHSMQYHYRKIDTWLEGVCRSVCPEHRWANG